MPICTRRGCGVDFDPSASSSPSTSSSPPPTAASGTTPCIHHPGAPVFHEGLKSWSCCNDTNKPVLEFDQFLAIPGCTTAPAHTTEKQAVPTVKNGKVVDSSDDATATTTGEHSSGSEGAVQASPEGGPTQPLSGGALAAAKNAQDAAAKGASVAETAWEEQRDGEDQRSAVELAPKTACKRSGCGYQHPGGTRDVSQEQCRYHKGSPIFHEGSKGWSCCKRRVLDFNDFLAIPPCTDSTSGHLFFGAGRSAAPDAAADTDSTGEEPVECRMDHYETPADVRLTVYAKSVDRSQSRITFTPETVQFDLLLPPAPAGSTRARRFRRDLQPFAAIDAEASSFTITNFKVELVLVKRAKGQSWPALERGERVFGYGLTFGRDKDK